MVIKFTINLINGRNPDIYEMRLMYNGENKEKLAIVLLLSMDLEIFKI